MKTKSLLLATAVLGSLLAVPAFATTVSSESGQPAGFEAPSPARLVSPTGLPRRHEGATVTLTLTIDENGQPHDVRVVSPRMDLALRRALVPVVSQWEFTPARKDGVPVSTRVVMPITLVDGENT